MTDDIKLLKNMIDESNGIVFFSGAGVSTESGLKDFRSKDGIYNIKLKYDETPEYMLSRTCFYNDTEMFYDFYKKYMNCTHAEPNITHKYLKKLEDKGKLKAIVTQNIDGLHTKAGNKNVYELHGTIYKNHCIKCNKEYSAEFVFNSKNVPICSCGGIIKPDVVLYEEMLPEEAYNNSIKAISNADMLIVAGTSLTVYPASYMVNYFRGKYLVIINLDKTDYDYKADLVINKKLGEVFKEM
ncbi:MAG: NAD-dependent protein deacylase [Bacilli bacterium]|nr:NAD-dependent protein deacylase [Bacilli bacterium]